MTNSPFIKAGEGMVCRKELRGSTAHCYFRQPRSPASAWAVHSFPRSQLFISIRTFSQYSTRSADLSSPTPCLLEPACLLFSLRKPARYYSNNTDPPTDPPPHPPFNTTIRFLMDLDLRSASPRCERT